MVLCPRCLEDTDAFAPNEDNTVYTCPRCQEPVPLRYVQDYARYLPVVFSIIGFRGHGKTVYLSSLLYELERLVCTLPTFSYAPLDEQGLTALRARQADLEQGMLPESTQKVFPAPVILRLEGMAELKHCHLLMYDTSGEAIMEVANLTDYGSYVSRSEIVLLLISLKELTSPTLPADFVTRYVEAMLKMQRTARKQTLLVVLTKGDEMLDMEGLPEDVRLFLTGNRPADCLNDWRVLSQSIESWLAQQPIYANFVRRAQMEFASVYYCAVSALGSAPEGKTQTMSVAPRGVLIPLRLALWLESERRRPVMSQMVKDMLTTSLPQGEDRFLRQTERAPQHTRDTEVLVTSSLASFGLKGSHAPGTQREKPAPQTALPGGQQVPAASRNALDLWRVLGVALVFALVATFAALMVHYTAGPPPGGQTRPERASAAGLRGNPSSNRRRDAHVP